ncbi:hypothetical protein K439DRAFT_1362692 [Ramaria rubella]|nr:hypothetical protein K439DRAFT_1362692 [Ramaria rubella]
MKQDSPLWFNDGNMVLITVCTAFKVHQGIMERHSSVFKDLLSLPQPNIVSEFDGVPVVRMYDQPEELEYFLLALYDGLYLEQHCASDFPILSGILRLSIKYFVEKLRLECLKFLQHDWPMTLTAWDLREQESITPNGAYESAWIRPHPILVINLAHELGPAGATLLPAAFYDLSRYNCSHIWTGCPTPSPSPSITSPTGFTRLSPKDLQTVMIGKEASQSFIARFLRRELEGRKIALLCEHGAYDDGKECCDAFDELAHEVYRGIVGVTCGRDSDPLFTLGAAVMMQQREDDGNVGMHPASKACEQCRAEFAEVALAARRYVWDQLPCWFGLTDMLHGAKGH